MKDDKYFILKNQL